MFVGFEYRKKGKAKELVKKVEEIAKRLNCERVLTTIDKETNNWEINEKGILSAGYKKVNDDTLLYYVKELKDG